MIPSLDEQLRTYRRTSSENPITFGSVALLLSGYWFDQWKRAVGFSNPPDGDVALKAIDNRHLLLNGKVKPTLTEGRDFFLMSPPAWALFKGWYTAEPEIPVDIISHPITGAPIPILTRWTFSVYYGKEVRSVETHKYAPISALKAQICALLGLDPSKTRLIDYWNQNYRNRLDEANYVWKVGLIDTQGLLVEVQDSEGRWPRTSAARLLPTRTNSSTSMGIAPFGGVFMGGSGHVGLVNLGNTCYFNSTVQALAHTQLLATFLIRAQWRSEVSHENKFSTEGHLANAFALTVDDIWGKRAPYVNPERLHRSVVYFAPIFGDGEQHDAQELMMFLLDGIHQDLNKGSSRTYTEGVEGDLADDELGAEAAWKRHKLANDSPIVDIFHGQLRTKLVCPDCGFASVVFDPYVSVTLPLPTERMVSVRYFFTPADPRRPRYQQKISVRGDEAGAILAHVRARYGAENPVCVDRDELTAGFGVKLLTPLRKVEYFVFDLPHPDRLYTFVSVYLQFTNQKFNPLVDGPLAIEAPVSLRNIQRVVKRQLAYYWEGGGGTDRVTEAKLAERANPEWFKGKRKVFGIPVREEITEFVASEEFTQITTQSLKVILNPELTRATKGFSWASVMPIDRTVADCDAQKPKMDLDACFKSLSEPCTLEERNEWFCPKCQKPVRANAQIDIWSVPDVLIFHLKRFVVRDTGFKKVTSKVAFPEETDLRPYVQGPQKNDSLLAYKLYASVHHSGTMTGGHYTANIVDPDGKWWTFNDESVYPKATNENGADTAYVLLYRRMMPPPTPAPAEPDGPKLIQGQPLFPAAPSPHAAEPTGPIPPQSRPFVSQAQCG
jgi:ubiquitin carboxyl-terminal hydrolase 4/11/15